MIDDRGRYLAKRENGWEMRVERVPTDGLMTAASKRHVNIWGPAGPLVEPLWTVTEQPSRLGSVFISVDEHARRPSFEAIWLKYCSACVGYA